MSRFEIHRASDDGTSFGSFPHSRTVFLIILRAEGQEIFEGISLASSRHGRVIESEEWAYLCNSRISSNRRPDGVVHVTKADALAHPEE